MRLLDVLQRCRIHFAAAALFSAGVNILYLAPTIYMMQVSDRVILSGSLSTLIWLSVCLIIALLMLSILDHVRAQVLIRTGTRIDSILAPVLFKQLSEIDPKTGRRRTGQVLRELDTLRQFITGNGAHTIFDLPWIPIYIGVIFISNWWLGALAACGAMTSLTLAAVNEVATRRSLNFASRAANQSYERTDDVLRNSDVVFAMGMLPALMTRWQVHRRAILGHQERASDRGAFFTSLSRFLRIILQSSTIAIGAWLALEHEITSGGMFAASLLLGRALAPVEQLVGSWRSFVSARQSWQRIEDVLSAAPPATEPMALPRPDGGITAERIIYAFPGVNAPAIRGLSFEIMPGECIGIIGPSASGKSTLARMLLGVVPPMGGKVRLDGADVARWPRERLGPHVGYLPQDVRLLSGTIAENIARFGTPDPAAVLDAAKFAQVHDMILTLPQGYDTKVGEGGIGLSGGQTQRIGFARAIYGDPKIVVLDEPNANLDGNGELVLLGALQALKRAGSTIILIAHRPTLMTVTDRIMILQNGSIAMFDQRNTVLAALNGGAAPNQGGNAQAPRIVAGGKQ